MCVQKHPVHPINKTEEHCNTSTCTSFEPFRYQMCYKTKYCRLSCQLWFDFSNFRSEDDLDSEIEEALYSQVHYASSLLVSEKSAPGMIITELHQNYISSMILLHCLSFLLVCY